MYPLVPVRAGSKLPPNDEEENKLGARFAIMREVQSKLESAVRCAVRCVDQRIMRDYCRVLEAVAFNYWQQGCLARGKEPSYFPRCRDPSSRSRLQS